MRRYLTFLGALDTCLPRPHLLFVHKETSHQVVEPAILKWSLAGNGPNSLDHWPEPASILAHRLREVAPMSSAICTLFEGNYHYGLGALTNSLYERGFRGTIWAGYRGALPPWVRDMKGSDGDQWFEVAEGMTLRFLKVETQRHFTNYKADFMIHLRKNYVPDTVSMFYFDPDIVLKAEWPFIEQWAGGGVALCEDINSPMHSTHPIRVQWGRFFAPKGFKVARKLDVYVNAGFVGVSQGDWEFVETWQRLLALMESEATGLSKLDFGDRSFLFHKPDQDALNMTAMFSERAISIVGREGMDFIPGGYLLSHALGTSKPWRKSFTREALRGYPPTMADHSFLQHTTSPIDLFPASVRSRKKIDLMIGCAIGRFYARN